MTHPVRYDPRLIIFGEEPNAATSTEDDDAPYCTQEQLALFVSAVNAGEVTMFRQRVCGRDGCDRVTPRHKSYCSRRCYRHSELPNSFKLKKEFQRILAIRRARGWKKSRKL